jgi:hypothetical protein
MDMPGLMPNFFGSGVPEYPTVTSLTSRYQHALIDGWKQRW